MSIALFEKKYELKSNEELEIIAMNSKSYVFDARYAAISLLKKRKVMSPSIEIVENEFQKLNKIESSKKANVKEEEENVIENLKNISLNETRIFGLENGNELQVTRVSGTNFRIRIEDFYRSFIAPVMICSIKNETKIRCYPFFYTRNLIIWGVGGTIVMAILNFLSVIKFDWVAITLPLVFITGLQIFLMPILYFIILKFFKQELGRKNAC